MGVVYFTTNLELWAFLFTQALGSALQLWVRSTSFVFQTKSPGTPMVQDSSLEELEALSEEAAGGDEDREKEILMERIQSIKEEKQVS